MVLIAWFDKRQSSDQFKSNRLHILQILKWLNQRVTWTGNQWFTWTGQCADQMRNAKDRVKRDGKCKINCVWHSQKRSIIFFNFFPPIYMWSISSVGLFECNVKLTGRWEGKVISTFSLFFFSLSFSMLNGCTENTMRKSTVNRPNDGEWSAWITCRQYIKRLFHHVYAYTVYILWFKLKRPICYGRKYHTHTHKFWMLK